MNSGHLRRLLIGGLAFAAALAVAGPAVSAWRGDHATDDAARACRTIASESAARNAIVTTAGPRRVTVLGDSYSAGYGLTDPGVDSWPSLVAAPLHATVTVRSLGGTGYVASPCGPHDTFADRAAAVRRTTPALVIVQGGLNDVLASPAAIRTGATRLVAELDGLDVLLVGPPAAPKWRTESAKVDRALSAFAAEHGVRYVSTKSWPLTFSADGIHPDAAGYCTFAARVAEAAAQ